MFKLFKVFISPMASLFLLTIGASNILTLQTVVLHEAQVSSLIIGLLTAVYYLGFVYAAFSVENFIIRVAHIRAYAAFAAIFASLAILQGIFKSPELWLMIRLIAGFCSAGLFVVIESWILSQSTPKIRGQALALYMFVYYAAQTAGQLMLKIGYEKTLLLFSIASMLCSLSIVPLAMTKTSAPEITQPSVLKFKSLYQKSPSGMIGCFISGILIGPLYGLLPLYIARYHGTEAVATAMAVCILGGMLWQYPFGRLSDHVDRRLIIALAFLLIFAAALILLFFNPALWLWYSLLFLLGGTVLVIYPLSMSHACDVLDNKDMIAATQGLVLGNSIGMIIGPLLSATLIRYINARVGLLGFFAVISLATAVFFIWRSLTSRSAEPEQEFIGIPRITPVAVEIDPRIEEP